jgi:hypothetical protein
MLRKNSKKLTNTIVFFLQAMQYAAMRVCSWATMHLAVWILYKALSPPFKS